MSASNYLWIASFLIGLISSDRGVTARAADSSGLLSRSAQTADESAEPTLLRTGAPRRRAAAEAHRERCGELAAPWVENTLQGWEEDEATRLQLRVRPPGASRGSVFPGKPLFSLIRRVYRCCQEGGGCWSVKGIQGRFRGDAGVEFVLTREVLSPAVLRAELHLQLSNPHHLDVRPIIPFVAKRNFPTRYRLGSLGADTLELTVDVLFLFHHLQEMAGGAGRGRGLGDVRRVRIFSDEDLPGEKPSFGVLQEVQGDEVPAVNLGLILGCSRAGTRVPCEGGGLQLSHTPFMVLYYR